MAAQTINNGDLLNVVRTKINQNFTEMEVIGNKTQAISATPSTTKYPSEKAVSDFASKIYSSSSVPTSKSGDLILHTNAPSQTGGLKGKIKYNAGGTLTEFISDRSICSRQSASSLANTILLAGEIAVETDTNGMKIGDGTKPFSALPFIGATSEEGGGGGTSEIASGGGVNAGWIKFPNGLILQWGALTYQTDSNGNLDVLVTMPTAFYNRVYAHGFLQKEENWNDSQLLVHSRFFNNAQLRFVCDAYIDKPLGSLALYELHWIALGF